MSIIITLTEGNERHFVPADHIVKLEAIRAYTVLHEKTGKQYVMSSVLGNVLKELYSNDDLKKMFFRVNRSYAVNLKEVTRYVKGRGGKVVLSDNAVIAVAQRRKTELLRVLQKLKGK